jgi:alpha-glucosidase
MGESLGVIVESTLGTDLAKPSVLGDVSYVKPGRASWSWVLMKDPSVNYEVQKEFIDYAAQMGWEYCLVDADWDTRIGWDKIGELARMAAKKNVGIIQRAIGIRFPITQEANCSQPKVEMKSSQSLKPLE